MADEEVKDETSNFEVVSSDDPTVASAAEEPEAKQEETPKADADEGKEEQPKGEEEQAESGEGATAEGGEADEDGEEAKPKKQNRVQKRIDEVVREREEAKRRAEAAEKRLAELEKDKQPKKEEQQAKEPVESDFDTYDDYLEALDKFDQQQEQSKSAEPEEPKGDDSDSDEGGLTDAQRTAMAVIKEKVDQDAEKYSDFEEVALNPEVPITGDMLEALAECEDPTKVMYHLGQNKDLAAEIAGKSPAQQMREITRLDLTADVKPPKPAQTSKAAEPIEPVGGSDAQKKSVGEMSFSEYEDHMNKQEQASGTGWN